jgi:hypothetical protein
MNYQSLYKVGGKLLPYFIFERLTEMDNKMMKTNFETFIESLTQDDILNFMTNRHKYNCSNGTCPAGSICRRIIPNDNSIDDNNCKKSFDMWYKQPFEGCETDA